MDLSGGMKCIKLILFAFNFIVWLIGGIAFGIGIWLYMSPLDVKELREIEQFDLKPFLAALMALGGMTFFLGFLGCCGAFTENRFALLLYAFFVGLLLLGLIVIVALSVKYKAKITDSLKEELMKMVNASSDSDDYKALRGIEKAMNCCGINNYTDYSDHNLVVPLTCCKYFIENVTETVDKCEKMLRPSDVTSVIYEEGCYGKVKAVFMSNVKYVIIVVAILATVKVFCVISACLLARAIEETK